MPVEGACESSEIRLHPAGRGLACKPDPSNLTRNVRRHIARFKSKSPRAGTFKNGGSGVCYLVISSSTILFQNSSFSFLE